MSVLGAFLVILVLRTSGDLIHFAWWRLRFFIGVALFLAFLLASCGLTIMVLLGVMFYEFSYCFLASGCGRSKTRMYQMGVSLIRKRFWDELTF